MRRRRFLVLGATVLLAGCGGDDDGPANGHEGNGHDTTPTTSPRETHDGADDGTPTATPDGIENQTGEDRSVGGSGQFQPSVTYNTCRKVTIEADEPYSAVAIGLVDGTNEMHQEGYEGTTTFEADQTIDEVLIWSEGDDKSNKINPDLESCPGPN